MIIQKIAKIAIINIKNSKNTIKKVFGFRKITKMVRLLILIKFR